MAIPFSLPASSGGRHHRESLAASTGINTNVSFSDLNLSSQLLYLAMVEALRVVKDIAEEVSDEDLEYANYDYGLEDDPDCEILPKKKSDQADKIREECTKYEDLNMDSQISGQRSVEGEYDKETQVAGLQQPDLVADITGIRATASSIVPDIVSCVTMTNADDTYHSFTGAKTDHISSNGQLMDHKILPDLVLDAVSSRNKTRVPSIQSLQSDDLTKPQNEFNEIVALNKPCQTVRGTHNIRPDEHDGEAYKKPKNDDRSQWRKIGRDLARLADSHGCRDGVRSYRDTSAPDTHHHSHTMLDDFERGVGMNWRSFSSGAHNRNNHHLHNRLCHRQLSSLHNVEPVTSQWIVSGITNIALSGLLYIVNNLL